MGVVSQHRADLQEGTATPPRLCVRLRRRLRLNMKFHTLLTRQWSRSTVPFRWPRNRCEIWTGTQFQNADHAAAVKATGLQPSQVQLHTTFLGGGFGRRASAKADFVLEAVEVAKAVRQPVKVVWTRARMIFAAVGTAQWPMTALLQGSTRVATR